MKKNRLLSTLSLGLIAAVLASCDVQNIVSFTKPVRMLDALGSNIRRGEPDVREDEDGEVIIVNGQSEDPTSRQITSLKFNVAAHVLFYSDSTSTGFNEEYTPELSVTPTTASREGLRWSSSNEAVATVDNSGLVKAVSQGSATITVTTSDGKISASCNVVVNKSNVSTSKTTRSATNILAHITDPSFVSPDPMYMGQQYRVTEAKGDAIVSYMDDFEEMYLSKEQAYFRIVDNSQEMKTEGGSSVPDRVDYIFYTTDTYYTYCLNGFAKRKLVLDQSSLMKQGKTKFDALCEVLDNFFVAGSSIVTRLPNQLTGYDELFGKEYSGAKYMGSLGEDSGAFAYYKTQGGSWAARAEDEEDLGIPAGTVITLEDKLRYLWTDNLIANKSINEKILYKINGVDCYQLYDIEYSYKTRDVELFYPDVKDYATVADIFAF